MTKQGFSKVDLRRQIERERRAEANRRCKELKTRIRLARAARAEAIKTIAAECRAARVTLRQQCVQGAAMAKLEGQRKVAAAREQLEGMTVEELRERRAIARSEGRARGPGVRRAAARVTSAESDDEVRRNIAPELVPVFDSVRRQIRGVAGKVTRTEAFLEWAEAHPEAVYEVAQLNADRELAAMIAEHDRERAIAVKRVAFSGQF